MPLDPTVRELATDAAQELLGVDGKLLATARRLVLRPGALTVDYLAGRRTAFVGPVRVYLASSVIVFALLAAQPPSRTPTTRNEFRMFGVARVSVDVPDSVATRLKGTQRLGLGVRALLRMRAAVRAGPERHAQLERRVTNTIPQTFFLIVPAYAGVLWLVAPRPRRHYPAHLCFALHVQAFAFAALAVALGVRAGAAVGLRAPPGGRPYLELAYAAVPATFAVAGAWVLAYVGIAYRRVYATPWPGTVVRVVAGTALYLILLGVSTGALLMAVLLTG